MLHLSTGSWLGEAPLAPGVPTVTAQLGTIGTALREQLRDFKADVIYALLNAYDGSSEAVCEALDADLGLPIVRHYKEHSCEPWEPERRSLTETSAQIYLNRESYEHFHRLYGVSPATAHLLDADLISAKYMGCQFARRLGEWDAEPHILIAGSVSTSRDRYDVRHICLELERRRIHTHLYAKFVGLDRTGSTTAGCAATEAVYRTFARAHAYVHLHDPIPPPAFTEVWSQYDAGLMHASVDGQARGAAFQRLNLGHRYSAYLAAGLPLLVHQGGQDALERLVREQGLGIIFRDPDHLADSLRDRPYLDRLTRDVRARRHHFSFEAAVPTLIEIFSAAAGAGPGHDSNRRGHGARTTSVSPPDQVARSAGI